MTLLEELRSVLEKDKRFVADDRLLKNRIVEAGLKLDGDLIKLLLSKKNLKKHFFTNVDNVLVFDKEKFMKFVDNKEFLPNSYTAFKNKIGLSAGQRYISKSKEVVLSWPYKDCILEGGQKKGDEKRNEVFHNEILAPDEIDRLLEPKVFTNSKRIDAKGEHTISEIKQTDNLIIKGNNLLVLYSLKNKFSGKVKLIYIDQPYNIGNDEFKYNDSFNHSTWLTFMRNRLKVAKDLLHKEGAIFVQIDHHELGYLNILIDEIFGPENKVQIISVKTASPAGFKTVNPGPIEVTEYILFYTKSRKDYDFKRNYVSVGYHENYNRVIVNKDEDPSKWKLEPIKKIVLEENGIAVHQSIIRSYKEAEKKWGKYWRIIFEQLIAAYALENRNKVVSVRDPHKPVDRLKKILEKSKKNRDKVYVYKRNLDDEDKEPIYIINGGALAFYSNKVQEIDGEITPTELLTDFWDDISWAGIANEGGVKLKSGKKPEKLLRRIIDMTTIPNDIVLDFFMGSGTTCAVAHKMGRQYIGIEQLDYGKNSAIFRLTNVVKGDHSGISKIVGWKGGGNFVYCELTELNEKLIQDIKNAKDTKELFAIWEEMKNHAFLSYKIDPKDIDANINDFKDLSFNGQKRFLIECLDKNDLYVNYSEIEDKQYNISKEDGELNRKFYSGF